MTKFQKKQAKKILIKKSTQKLVYHQPLLTHQILRPALKNLTQTASQAQTRIIILTTPKTLILAPRCQKVLPAHKLIQRSEFLLSLFKAPKGRKL